MSQRKNPALEIALIALAFGVAIIVQLLISHAKPPKLPEFPKEKTVLFQREDQKGNPDDAGDEDRKLRIPTGYSPHLADLGEEPDWSELDQYQYCISRDEFERLLNDVYTVDGGWKQWIQIEPDHAVIRTSSSDEKAVFQLDFATDLLRVSPPRYWRDKTEIKIVSSTQPLAGVRIAIDPGHIGGDFAAVEQRRMVMQDGVMPIQEGSMTLGVAIALRRQLEDLGATVTMLREKTKPVNPFKPEDYYPYVQSKLEHQKGIVNENNINLEADLMFYRVGEIRARALLLNEAVKPDLVLCIHFNAAADADPEKPVLFENEHFHMILNGAYTSDELAHDDERLQMLMKLIQGGHEVEADMAAIAASNMVRNTGLPPYEYTSGSGRAVNVRGNPYLWARNLLANRMYSCPVLYYEPYLMNGKDSYLRMQMGDYDGLRYVNGKLRVSIYREYVNAVTQGLVEYFTQKEQ